MKLTRFLAMATALGLGAANAALVSHFTFDEAVGSTTAVNSVSGAANGAIGSNVTLGATGVFGTAFTFNNDASQNGIVDMGNATGLFSAIAASGQITISVWLNWGTLSANRDSAIFLGDDTVGNRYIDIGTAGNTNSGVYGRTRDNQGTGFSDGIQGSGLSDGEWHHIAYTSNQATGEAQLYIDGVAQPLQTGVNTFPSVFNNFEVGRLGRGGAGPTDAFAGSIDELRIYDEVLSSAAIAALAVPEPGVSALLGLGSLCVAFRRRK